ncbi:MAG: hypothetical protein H6831_09990 [Planctomycetes bacterium]|nr:hypothetical protein [Planctomycetota bacterium]MCB9904724.1 hypothetical protein [Planctomycetota bacterium]
MRRATPLLLVGVFAAGLLWMRSFVQPKTSVPEVVTSVQRDSREMIRGSVQKASYRKYGCDIVCDFWPDLDKRAVAFHWRNSAILLTPHGPQASHSTSESVRFDPNYVEWIADDQLLVAGVSAQSGSTVIEVWRYAECPDDSIVRTRVLEGGAVDVQWSTPRRTSVERVFESNEEAHGVVIFAKENLGRPGHVILRLHSSGAFFDLELASGELAAIASPIRAEAPHWVPELADGAWKVGGSAVALKHAGFVYSVWTEEFPPDEFRGLHLVDSDHDGTIDRVSANDQSDSLDGDQVLSSF